MNTHPTTDELLSAVKIFIERIAPQLHDRESFLARVAVNAIGVVRRELEGGAAADAMSKERLLALLGQDGSLSQLNQRLCDEIKSGGFDKDDGPLLAHLRASVIDQVKVDQPGYSGLKVALSALTEPGGPVSEPH